MMSTASAAEPSLPFLEDGDFEGSHGGSNVPSTVDDKDLKMTYLGPAGRGLATEHDQEQQQPQSDLPMQQQQQHPENGSPPQSEPQSSSVPAKHRLGAAGTIVVGEGANRKEYRRCVICQDVTERRHLNYGADACFSCRAFFRRTHQKRQPPSFECKGGGECEVNARTRRRCQSCRYERCLRAGMRPEFVMGEEQRKARMEKCKKKREDKGNAGGSFDGQAQVNGGGGSSSASPALPDGRRKRKRLSAQTRVKEEPEEEDTSSDSYLLQLAEVAASQVGLDLKQEDGGDEQAEKRRQHQEHPNQMPQHHHHPRQRWHSVSADFYHGGANGGHGGNGGNGGNGGPSSPHTAVVSRQQSLYDAIASSIDSHFGGQHPPHTITTSSSCSNFVARSESNLSESWDKWRSHLSNHFPGMENQSQPHKMHPPVSQQQQQQHHHHHPRSYSFNESSNDFPEEIAQQQQQNQQQLQQPDPTLKTAMPPSDLDSNVTLLTAEIEMAHRLAAKKGQDRSGPDVAPHCFICDASGDADGTPSAVARSFATAWHAAIAHFMSPPDQPFLRDLILMHQRGPGVTDRQAKDHIDRLTTLFKRLGENESSNSTRSSRRASAMVDFVLQRYCHSSNCSAAQQLQWLLLCQLPSYLMDVLGLWTLPPEEVSSFAKRGKSATPSTLPYRSLPVLSYLMLRDSVVGGGVLLSKLRRSAGILGNREDASSSDVCDTCADSPVLVKNAEAMLALVEGELLQDGHKETEEQYFRDKLKVYRSAFRHGVPFDDEMLHEVVMYTLDVPISRGFISKGMTIFTDRFVVVAKSHRGLEDVDTKETLQALRKTTALFRPVALSLTHVRTLNDGIEQIKFCLGEDTVPEEEEQQQGEEGAGEQEQDWKKYEKMVGGRQLKKVTLSVINNKVDVMRSERVQRYNKIMDELMPVVRDPSVCRLSCLAALFEYPEEFGAACGAAADARRRYRAVMAGRGVLDAFDRAMPRVEELGEIIRDMMPNI